MSVNKTLNPRKIVVDALCKVEGEDAYSNLTLNVLLNDNPLSSENKALCSAVFYGVLDRKITLDFIIKRFIKVKFDKLDPFIKNLLRSSVYQIKFMDRIPNSAVVNETVKIVKASNLSHLSGFVNAVLRNVSDTDVLLPAGRSLYDISVRYSCPTWIIQSIINDYSVDDAISFLENSLLPPPTFIRVNITKISVKELTERLNSKNIMVETTDLPNTLIISGYSAIEKLPEYTHGYFFVQDYSCQTAISMLLVEDGNRVLDICSAPGGKSFCAALSANNVSILATELYEHRAKLVCEGAQRLSLDSISVKVADATDYNSEFGLFDRIICDVPCSGLGVIRRKPDIKYRLTQDLSQLEQTQLKILHNADNYLVKGGRILYSTCTVRRAENEQIVDKFLSEKSNYRLVCKNTFWPRENNSDGFFAAVLEKF